MLVESPDSSTASLPQPPAIWHPFGCSPWTNLGHPLLTDPRHSVATWFFPPPPQPLGLTCEHCTCPCPCLLVGQSTHKILAVCDRTCLQHARNMKCHLEVFISFPKDGAFVEIRAMPVLELDRAYVPFRLEKTLGHGGSGHGP